MKEVVFGQFFPALGAPFYTFRQLSLFSGLFIDAATLPASGAYMICCKTDEETACIPGAIPLPADGAVSLFMAPASS